MFVSIRTYDRGLTMVNIAWVGFKFIQTPSIDTKVMEFMSEVKFGINYRYLQMRITSHRYQQETRHGGPHCNTTRGCRSRPSRGLHHLTPKYRLHERPLLLEMPAPWLHCVEFNNNLASALWKIKYAPQSNAKGEWRRSP